MDGRATQLGKGQKYAKEGNKRSEAKCTTIGDNWTTVVERKMDDSLAKVKPGVTQQRGRGSV